MIEEKYYVIQEIADLLRVRKHSVYRWIKEKQIGVTRFGRREIRISESQLQAFLHVESVGKKPGDIWQSKK